MDAKDRQILKKIFFTTFHVGKIPIGIWAEKSCWDVYLYTENKFTYSYKRVTYILKYTSCSPFRINAS